MLSKTEMEFLKNPESFDAGYTRVMRHRIKAKFEAFRAQIALLEGYDGLAGASVTENCNGVTEYCNQKSELKIASKRELGAGNGIRTHADRKVHGLSRPAR